MAMVVMQKRNYTAFGRDPCCGGAGEQRYGVDTPA
jgi:hypothetical protein